MIEFFRDFHFLRPWCLLFLIPIVFLLLKKINISESLSSWSFVCDKKLLDFLLIKNKQKRLISFKTLIYLGLFSATIAVSGPTWKKIDMPTMVPENPTMFVLSIAQDMQLTDISPSRLMRAKYAIVDIAQNIANAQFGLEVYTMEPYVVSPITDDASIITNIMPQITPDIMPDFGDRADRAIELAAQKLQETGFNNGNIILLASDVGYRLDYTLKSAENARQMGFSVNVIDTSFSGSDKLELVAQKGGGMYLKLRENNLNLLIKKLSDINEKRMMTNKNMQSDYLDFGYYLLIIPLLCILPLFRRGFLCLLTLLFAFNAEASFLLNKNQEAFRFFNQKRYDEAYKLFDNPLWKSISLYKQDKLEEALKDIEKENDEKSLYNKGVILAKLCKYNEAKEVFQNVVKRFDNEDAKFNLMAIENLLVKAKENPSLLECGDNSSSGSGDGDSDEKNNNKDNNGNSDGGNNQNQNENDTNGENNNDDKQNSSSSSDEKNNNTENEQNKNDNQDSKNADNAQNNKSENNDNKNNEDTRGNQNNDDDKNHGNNNEMENKEQNDNKDAENKNNNDEKEQNNAEDKSDENKKKSGVKNIKKENESVSSDNKKEDDSENNNNNNQNNNEQKENERESSKDDNKTDENNNENSSQTDKEADKNKDGDSEKNKDDSKSNKNEKNKQDDGKGEGEDKQEDNNKAKNKQSYPETNKEKQGNRTDDFDASDKLSDNKNNNETGNLANIGDEVDEGEPVDEKELLIQRRYREIPDDVGGLLREMIKKEHFKGRYKNEKM